MCIHRRGGTAWLSRSENRRERERKATKEGRRREAHEAEWWREGQEGPLSQVQGDWCSRGIPPGIQLLLMNPAAPRELRETGEFSQEHRSLWLLASLCTHRGVHMSVGARAVLILLPSPSAPGHSYRGRMRPWRTGPWRHTAKSSILQTAQLMGAELRDTASGLGCACVGLGRLSNPVPGAAGETVRPCPLSESQGLKSQANTFLNLCHHRKARPGKLQRSFSSRQIRELRRWGPRAGS